MNSNMTEQLDQLFRMWDRCLCPGAQVLIRQHGKTLYEKCFGYGNLENKLKIHKESIFHVASISKEFTVMSILLLWKEGKLDLDDNIKKYLDEYINIETPITIRQMMNNVSGLRDQWELLFLIAWRGQEDYRVVNNPVENPVNNGKRTKEKRDTY